MNLLIDDFVSTTKGKVSLRTILTSDEDYQLQYYFDEVQLSMLQLLSSLATALFQPSISDLKAFLKNGVTGEKYEQALVTCNQEWFDSECFMQSKSPEKKVGLNAQISTIVSGIESGTSSNASGLFSNIKMVECTCSDCIHVLNYNLHMNIKGERFSKTGATGIRGGGAISTLISGGSLKQTILSNTIAVDYYNEQAQISENAENSPMWIKPLQGKVYQATNIGLIRGLFALAYHVSFKKEDKSCLCDICGHESNQLVASFNREKYQGHYGSTKNGRDANAGWWLHPFTPIRFKDSQFYPITARDQNWQSWQELDSYIIGKETTNSIIKPAYVVTQHQHTANTGKTALLVGGNIADQGSITGRVYDLFSMPSTLSRQHSKVTQVIDVGLIYKDKLKRAFFLASKNSDMKVKKQLLNSIDIDTQNRYIANAQQIIQQILFNVDKRVSSELREQAALELSVEAKRIYKTVQNKYQHDLPLFKALVKGETVFYKK